MTYLEALDQVDRDFVAGFATEVAHGHIRVQLTQSWKSGSSSRLSDVVWSQEELESSISFWSKLKGV